MSDCYDAPGFGHKPGCISKEAWPRSVHRTPIDCVTLVDLAKENDQLKDEMEVYRKETQRLKARIYDLEHEPF
jgi:hypothetical protein